MTKQFLRRVLVSVGPASGGESRQWDESLQIEFSVSRTAKGRPDQASVTLHNLSPESRGYLLAGDRQIVLQAGYQDDGSPPVLLRGGVDEVEVRRGQTGTTTIIKARDAGDAVATRQINRSWVNDISAHRLLQEIAQEMGLRFASLNGVEDRDVPGGFSLTGRVRDGLGSLVDSLGAEYAIRSGELVVTPKGQALPSQGFLISAETGLVGSPTAIKKKGRPMGLRVRTLLNGRLRPKDRIRLDSLDYQGVYEVRKLTHEGSSRGNDYYTTIECRAEKA